MDDKSSESAAYESPHSRTFSFIREIMNDIRFDAVTNGFLGTFDETNTQDLT